MHSNHTDLRTYCSGAPVVWSAEAKPHRQHRHIFSPIPTQCFVSEMDSEIPRASVAMMSNLHKGSKAALVGSNIDIGELIDSFKCSKEYYLLEDCLGEHNRSWKMCQTQVQMLKKCNEDFKS